MSGDGFLNRFITYSTAKQVILSWDWVAAAIIVLSVSFVFGDQVMSYNVGQYITSIIGLSQSLIAITVTGTAIVVSFTDKGVLATLGRIGSYDRLMITFESTVFLSIATTLLGIFIQLYSYGPEEVYLLTFVFIYLTINVFRLVSDIVTFGGKVANITMIQEMSDEMSDMVIGPEETNEEETEASTESGK